MKDWVNWKGIFGTETAEPEYTLSQIQDEYGISKSKLYRDIKDNNLKVRKIHGIFYIKDIFRGRG